MKTLGYPSGSSASARAGSPWRRTASKNSGQRSLGIVEQKSLARNLIAMMMVIMMVMMQMMLTMNLSTMVSMVLGSTSWLMEAWVTIMMMTLKIILPHTPPTTPWKWTNKKEQSGLFGRPTPKMNNVFFCSTFPILRGNTWSPMQHSSQVNEWSSGSAQEGAHIHSAFGQIHFEI